MSLCLKQTQQQLTGTENKNTNRVDKFIGILVKTIILVVSLSHLDCRLIFESRKWNVGEGCYFNINIKMNKNGKFAYIKAS